MASQGTLFDETPDDDLGTDPLLEEGFVWVEWKGNRMKVSIEDADVAKLWKFLVNDNGYATVALRKKNPTRVKFNKKFWKVHQLIMLMKDEDSYVGSCDSGLYIDHVNHDRLDNRRRNLRFVTPSQNNRNAKRNHHDDVGVRYCNRGKRRWAASCTFCGQTFSRHLYSKEAAIKWRKDKLKELEENSDDPQT